MTQLPQFLRCRITAIHDDNITLIDDEQRTFRLVIDDATAHLLESAWPGATLLLHDPVCVDDTADAAHLEGGAALRTTRVILHPDYLMDISSIASCFKEYGAHPLHYLYQMIAPHEATPYTLLGNTVNQFFDDCVQSDSTYEESLQKAFHDDALNYLTTDGLQQTYFAQLVRHYNNIGQTVTQTFPQRGIDCEKGILEPSFICPQLGLQGRMDFLSLNDAGSGSSADADLIELKSGKWDEYRHAHKLTHYVQMLLYAELLHLNQHIERDHIRAYLLYSTYPELVREPIDSGLINRALRLRNRVVGYLYQITQGRAPELYSLAHLDEVATNGNVLWERYEKPRMVDLLNTLWQSAPDVQDWFWRQLQFIITEDWLARTGSGDSAIETTERGASGLWLSSHDQKVNDGEIIAPMYLIDAPLDRAGNSTMLRFQVEEHDTNTAPNFRLGDDVLIYSADSDRVDATSRLILRGNLSVISPNEVSIALRQPLRRRVLDQLRDIPFTCEHDVINSTTAHQCRAIYRMLRAPQHWIDLLIHETPPSEPTVADDAPADNASTSDKDTSNTDSNLDGKHTEQQQYVSQLLQRMYATRDYFLLVGPPGTGKTSFVLRSLMEHLHNDCGETILLLSYTHRSVDEICRSLETIPGLDYLRFGNSLHCHPDFHPHLLRHRLQQHTNRRALKAELDQCRVYVGTTASVNMSHNLFQLKQFDAIIVDEASQLLEYQLIELLTYARRFFLIGDHKQLPAVTRQSCGTSLFERLISVTSAHAPNAAGTLIFQGRMHPSIAKFANRMFYNSQLRAIPVPHQLEAETIDGSKRYAFVHVDAPEIRGRKFNQPEAQVIARIIADEVRTYHERQEAFTAATLGVIVPYRSQIAAIKQELTQLGIDTMLPLIDIDTVERYQGSQRDIILYSATVSTPHQLEQLSVTQLIDGQAVDRKLNVILTRARRQFYFVGNRTLLRTSAIYRDLIDEMTAGDKTAETC